MRKYVDTELKSLSQHVDGRLAEHALRSNADIEAALRTVRDDINILKTRLSAQRTHVDSSATGGYTSYQAKEDFRLFDQQLDSKIGVLTRRVEKFEADLESRHKAFLDALTQRLDGLERCVTHRFKDWEAVAKQTTKTPIDLEHMRSCDSFQKEMRQCRVSACESAIRVMEAKLAASERRRDEHTHHQVQLKRESLSLNLGARVAALESYRKYSEDHSKRLEERMLVNLERQQRSAQIQYDSLNKRVESLYTQCSSKMREGSPYSRGVGIGAYSQQVRRLSTSPHTRERQGLTQHIEKLHVAGASLFEHLTDPSSATPEKDSPRVAYMSSSAAEMPVNSPRHTGTSLFQHVSDSNSVSPERNSPRVAYVSSIPSDYAFPKTRKAPQQLPSSHNVDLYSRGANVEARMYTTQKMNRRREDAVGISSAASKHEELVRRQDWVATEKASRSSSGDQQNVNVQTIITTSSWSSSDKNISTLDKSSAQNDIRGAEVGDSKACLKNEHDGDCSLQIPSNVNIDQRNGDDTEACAHAISISSPVMLESDGEESEVEAILTNEVEEMECLHKETHIVQTTSNTLWDAVDLVVDEDGDSHGLTDKDVTGFGSGRSGAGEEHPTLRPSNEEDDEDVDVDDDSDDDNVVELTGRERGTPSTKPVENRGAARDWMEEPQSESGSSSQSDSLIDVDEDEDEDADDIILAGL